MNEELGVATRSQRQSFKDHENNSELYFMAKSEEELRSLLMKVKEESEKVGLTFRKRRSWHLVPSLHGK